MSLTSNQTDFANKVYNNSTAQEDTGQLKQFPILLILTIISEVLQLIITYMPMFHHKTPAQVRETFGNMNIFQKLTLRRHVRQAIKNNEESVGDYEEHITSGIKNTFTSSSDGEISNVLKDFA